MYKMPVPRGADLELGGLKQWQSTLPEELYIVLTLKL
jgi:hypothetical protein